MLANQPDYTALMQFLFSEDSGGTGEKVKVAKRGDRRAEIREETIIINEPGKPTIKVYPQRKEYAEIPDKEGRDFAVSPEELAKRNDVVFRSQGTEKVGKYTCLKIEVSYQDEQLKGIKFLFWAAPELKNPVIRSDISLGSEVKFFTELEDVTLSVNEELFRIPADYKKVAELDYMKELEKNIRKPR
jgi:hypothetical protein